RFAGPPTPCRRTAAERRPGSPRRGPLLDGRLLRRSCRGGWLSRNCSVQDCAAVVDVAYACDRTNSIVARSCAGSLAIIQGSPNWSPTIPHTEALKQVDASSGVCPINHCGAVLH